MARYSDNEDSGYGRRGRASRYMRNTNSCISQSFHKCLNHVSHCYGCLMTKAQKHYLTLSTIFIIVVLSFLLPNVSDRIRATGEVTAVKTILNTIKNEVNQARENCLSSADSLCSLHNCIISDTTDTNMTGDYRSCTSQVSAGQSNKMGFLKKVCLGRRNASHKELTIMSYVYSDTKLPKKKFDYNATILRTAMSN